MEKGIQIGRQEGRQEGLQEGLQKGLQKGLQEGVRKGLLKALELGLLLKFGDRGMSLYPKLGQIRDVRVLEAIVEQLKTSDSLDNLAAFYRTAIESEHSAN